MPDRGEWFAPLFGRSGDDASTRSSDSPPRAAETAPATAPATAGFMPDSPSSVSEAARMAQAGLACLARADAATLPVPVLAECLRGLERMLAVHTAARARMLGAFSAQRGFEDDGQGS